MLNKITRSDQVVRCAIYTRKSTTAGLDMEVNSLHTQREVCLLLHAGFSQTRVGEHLGVSTATVVDHVRKIYSKLDVHSAIELVNLINSRKQSSAERSR